VDEYQETMASPNPDKPEPKAEVKGISRKAAKDAKEILKSWYFKPKDMAFLCELGVFARKFLAVLRRMPALDRPAHRDNKPTTTRRDEERMIL